MENLNVLETAVNAAQTTKKLKIKNLFVKVGDSYEPICDSKLFAEALGVLPQQLGSVFNHFWAFGSRGEAFGTSKPTAEDLQLAEEKLKEVRKYNKKAARQAQKAELKKIKKREKYISAKF